MHIAITGNIGAGKTTLATMLAKHFGWQVYFEEVDGNPYLAPFYTDMSKWAFHLQIFFLNSRFEQVLKIKSKPEETIIQDRTIYEDCFIFAQNLYNTGILNETDFNTYKGLFTTITKAVSPPDLTIYLKASLPKLVSQIQLRGRDYEQSIDPNYLESLNVLYTDFSNNYKEGNLIEIEVDNLDFVNNEDDFKYIINEITKHINLGTQLTF